MSIQNKINNARPTSWPAEGLPRWWVKFIIWWKRRKVRRYFRKRDKIFKRIDETITIENTEDGFIAHIKDWDLNLKEGE